MEKSKFAKRLWEMNNAHVFLKLSKRHKPNAYVYRRTLLHALQKAKHDLVK